VRFNAASCCCSSCTAPRNLIVGGGIFAYANLPPCSLAWEAFREANGARSAQEMRARIARYRRAEPDDRSDFEIGCRILTQPFFFEERDWIPVPVTWSPNIVSFKTDNTGNTRRARPVRRQQRL
jgi:putative restriction endonuclease